MPKERLNAAFDVAFVLSGFAAALGGMYAQVDGAADIAFAEYALPASSTEAQKEAARSAAVLEILAGTAVGIGGLVLIQKVGENY